MGEWRLVEAGTDLHFGFEITYASEDEKKQAEDQLSYQATYGTVFYLE